MFGPERGGEGRQLGDSVEGDRENEKRQLEGGLHRLLADSVWVSTQVEGYSTEKRREVGLGIVLGLLKEWRRYTDKPQ